MGSQNSKHGIGEKIKMYRRKCNLSQKELAEIIGVSNNRLSNWEQGINRPNIDKLCKLCIPLYATPNQLLGINSVGDRLTEKEWEVINAYRNLKPEKQEAVEKLLEIKCKEAMRYYV